MANRSANRLLILLATSIFITAVASWRIQAALEWRYPLLTDLVPNEQYTADLGAILLGTHRLAADLAYIQFLQYYGTEENDPDIPEFRKESGEGYYPLVESFGKRLLMLDPFFNATILEIAGALAFNLKRADQSLDLLAEAIRRDPAYYRYRIYVAAILYKNDKTDERLINMLKQAIEFRDCPSLLKIVLGNLLKKNHQYLDAAYVFRKTIESAPVEGDRNTAATKLKEIIKEHPETRVVLDGPGRY